MPEDQTPSESTDPSIGYTDTNDPSCEQETVSPDKVVGLDNTISTGEALVGPDAGQRAVPTEVPTALSSEEGTMSDNAEENVESGAPAADPRIDKLERSIELLTNLVTKLAETRSVTAPVAPVEDPLELANRRAEELQAKLTRAMTAAGRIGLGNVTRERVEAVGGYRGMAKRTASVLGETSALRMVAEGQAERRDSKTCDRSELETDLRGLLAAAFADGVISDPNNTTGWEG